MESSSSETWFQKRERENREQGICVRCRKAKAELGKTRCTDCRLKGNQAQVPRNHLSKAKLRAEVIAKYGGKCVCCSISWAPYLQLHHINGDGAEHRKAIASDTYTWARQNNYPAILQLVCCNCHQALTQGWECCEK